MKRTNNMLDQARHAARNKYAWPGGYPLALLMADGECICPDCAKREWKQVARATKAKLSDWPDKQWRVEDVFINWEDDDLYCAHCNEKIESAYGTGE